MTVYTDSVEALNNTCPSEALTVNVDWITQTSKYLTNKVDRYFTAFNSTVWATFIITDTELQLGSPFSEGQGFTSCQAGAGPEELPALPR